MTDSIRTSSLRSALDLTEALRSCASPAAFSATLVSGIATVVKSDQASLNEIDVVSREIAGTSHPVPLTAHEQAIVQVLMPAHPIVRHYMGATETDVRTLSDFWTQRDLCRSRLYAQYYRARHIHYQLAVELRGRPGTRRALVVSRSGTDYTPRERELMKVVGSQAVDLEDLVSTRSLVREVLADMDGHDGSGVVLLDRAGMIESVTGTARSALARYFPGRSSQLPRPIADWITGKTGKPLAVTGQDGLLTITMYAGPAGSTHVLLLRERRHHMQTPDLTPREQQVLALLAAGLPNKSIARQLGIAVPTVKTYVAAICRKLKAGNRTEAVAAAARRGLIRFGEATDN